MWDSMNVFYLPQVQVLDGQDHFIWILWSQEDLIWAFVTRDTNLLDLNAAIKLKFSGVIIKKKDKKIRPLVKVIDR